jgi:hypothetical protein
MTQFFHLHDFDPLRPFPSISDPSANVSPKRARVKAIVEVLHVQAFDYAFDASSADQHGSPNRRQPWLSSVLFSHDSKRRTFARSKLNHSASNAHALDKSGAVTPRSPRVQFNSPAASRVTTAGVQTALSLRSLEWEGPKAARSYPQLMADSRKEAASSAIVEKKVLRLHFHEPIHDSNEITMLAKSATTCEQAALLASSVASESKEKDKDLQIVDLPALSSYAPSSGLGALFIQSKALPMTPRGSNSSSNVRKQPPVINLCDPIVPPLKLQSDDLKVSKTISDRDAVVSERKLRFAVPNDTYYRIRGSQSERSSRSYVPYPISIANMAYSGKDFLKGFEANDGSQESKSPSRPAKSSGGTPRSPVVLSRTLFVPAPPVDTRAQSAPRPRANDHIVTAEMQLKGILIDAGAVTASLCDCTRGNAPPMYSGAVPKTKNSTSIGDKMWSRTARNAAAADK